ncbi:MAG: hypothetical protein P1U65_02945 [Minwuia sp.]|nr:hypothetical protein [Minwuia sp.]
MSDHFLKFDDAATGDAALTAAGMAGATGPGWAVERLGTLMTAAVIDADGEIVGTPTALAGYHVNIRLIDTALPSNLTAVEIFPVTPNRRFA